MKIILYRLSILKLEGLTLVILQIFIVRKHLVEFSRILKVLFQYLISQIRYLRYYLERLNYALILSFFIKRYLTLKDIVLMIVFVTLLTFGSKDF